LLSRGQALEAHAEGRGKGDVVRRIAPALSALAKAASHSARNVSALTGSTSNSLASKVMARGCPSVSAAIFSASVRYF